MKQKELLKKAEKIRRSGWYDKLLANETMFKTVPLEAKDIINNYLTGLDKKKVAEQCHEYLNFFNKMEPRDLLKFELNEVAVMSLLIISIIEEKEFDIKKAKKIIGNFNEARFNLIGDVPKISERIKSELDKSYKLKEIKTKQLELLINELRSNPDFYKLKKIDNKNEFINEAENMVINLILKDLKKYNLIQTDEKAIHEKLLDLFEKTKLK